MKLSFWRLAIVNLLAVCLLNIVGTQVTNLFSEIDANSTSPRRSEAIGTDRFLFMRNGKFGYIDRNGKIVIPARYAKAWDFGEGLAAVSTDGKTYGAIDTNGKMTISPKFEFIYGFKNGLARIQSKDRSGIKYGYIDRTGKIVIPARYRSAEDFSEGLAAVSPIDKKSDDYGYIDRTGKKVVRTETSSTLSSSTLPDVEPRSLDKFSNGLSPRLVGDLLGYKNKAEKLVIPARYEIPERGMGEYVSELSIVFRGNNDRYASTSINFHGGLAAVILPERCGILWTRNCYGYIDTTGKLVFKF
jgi:bifunctional DNA-binding transcriptional regulator/antitoxin component of YhaV-PrlF toxin-antitoxin module